MSIQGVTVEPEAVARWRDAARRCVAGQTYAERFRARREFKAARAELLHLCEAIVLNDSVVPWGVVALALLPVPWPKPRYEGSSVYRKVISLRQERHDFSVRYSFHDGEPE